MKLRVPVPVLALYRVRLLAAQYELYLCRTHGLPTGRAKNLVKMALTYVWWAQGEKDAW